MRKRIYKNILGLNAPWIEFKVEETSIDNSLININAQIDYYENLMKVTHHSVRRKKIENELKWWKQELVYHNKWKAYKEEQ